MLPVRLRVIPRRLRGGDRRAHTVLFSGRSLRYAAPTGYARSTSRR